MRHALSLLIIFFLFLSSSSAQNEKAQWNLREKDRLVQSIQDGETYRGVIIPKYKAEAHRIIPSDEGISYIRINMLDSVVCQYPSKAAEEVVQEIFRDMQNREASACSTHHRVPVFEPKQKLIGHQDGELLIGLKQMEQDYVIKTAANKAFEMPGENMTAVAVIDEAMLILDQNKKLYFKNRKGKMVDIASSDLLKKYKVQKNNFRVNGSDFYFNVAVEEKASIAQLNAKNGDLEVLNIDGRLLGFSDDFIYFFSEEAGFARMSLKDSKVETLLSKSLFFDFLEFPPFFIPNQNDEDFYLSAPRGGVLMAREKFFNELNLDFSKLNSLENSFDKMKADFEEEGIDPWDYLALIEPSATAQNEAEVEDEAEMMSEAEDEAMMEMEMAEEAAEAETEMAEEVAEAEMEIAEVAEESEMTSAETEADNSSFEDDFQEEEKPPLKPLSEAQEARIKEFSEIKTAYYAEKRRIKDEIDGTLDRLESNDTEATQLGFIPEGYNIAQNPMDRSIILLPNDPSFPMLTEADILRLKIDQ